MNLVNQYRFLTKALALAICLIAYAGLKGQNLNNPNKQGPLGTQVNTLTGNLFFKRTDFYIPARALDIRIAFSYNSYNSFEQSPYGRGWSFEYDIRYKDDTLPGGKIIVWGDGREDTYDSLSSGGFRTPKGFFSVLSQYQPGKYKLRQKNGLQYFFDNAVHKKVTRIEEPNGNFISFNYTDTLLTSLSNAAGQTVTFNYNLGRLSTVTENLASPARTFSYFYDLAGNLKEVMDPLSGRVKYTYLINGPMKTLSDKNGNIVNIIYYPDFATSELIGCNKRISFSYDTTSQTTIVTDYVESGNQVTKYKYQKLDNLSWISSMSGNCCGFNISYDYDSRGNPVKMTDANGNIFTYTYDSLGNALTVNDPFGQESRYTYSSDFNKVTSYTDPKGNVYTIIYDVKGNLTLLQAPGNLTYTATYAPNGDILTSTDPKGNIYTYQYDAWGNPANVTGPNGYNATLSFDARGRLLSVTDAKGNQSFAEYDILNRLKKITDPLNQIVQLNYDARGNIVSKINQNNEITRFGYDASNRLVKVTGATGNESFFAYDAMNNLKTIKNPLGHLTILNYDHRNRLKEFKNPDNNSTTFEYDGNGNITRIQMANGRTIQLVYDALDRLISAGDNAGSLGSLTYDKNNNIASMTNGGGAVITALYDSLNRVKQLTDPFGNSSKFTYDANSNVITVTDREGHSSHYTYDSLNRVKTVTDNNGFVVSIGYDAIGNIIELKDQNNNITNYTYDSLNRRKKMIFPDGTFREYFYDPKGNLISMRFTDGGVAQYQYDTLNRITSRTLPDGEVFTYTYDKLGRVLTATNSSGTASFTYDVLNRVTSESFDGRTISYDYSVAGRTQTTTYPDGSEVIKEFDTRNRLIKLMRDSMVLASYVYNNANQLTEKIAGNGVKTTMQYDFANRLLNITTGNGLIQNTSFTYDKEGNKTSITRNNNPALSEQFIYDNGYRLINYKRGPIGSPAIHNTYTYDAVGNRTAANLNGVSINYNFNNLNQLTGVNGINFTFDGRGNLTYDGAFYKTYDAENRLLKDSSSPTNVIRYMYDAMNRRVLKQEPGITFKYTYSGTQPVEERDAVSGVVLNSTTFNSFLRPLSNDRNGSRYFYHANEMGSVEAISNEAGRIVESYQYDAFGKLSRFDSLGNLLVSSLAGNRFGFTGQEYDSASDSYRFFYRNYSAQTGVFNQRDLIEYGDGMGMYQYVGNNPANGIDVWGLQDCGSPKRKDIATPVSFADNILLNILESEWITNLDKPSASPILHELRREYKDLMKNSLIQRFGNELNEVNKNYANKLSGRANDVMSEIKRVEKADAVRMSGFDASNAANAKSLKSLGLGLDVLDLLVKGEAFASSLVDGKSNEQYTQEIQAGGDLAITGITTGTASASPIGMIYEITDLTMTLTTGEGVTGHTANTGDFLGNTYSHFAYGTRWEMQWGRPARVDENVFTGNLYAYIFYGVPNEDMQPVSFFSSEPDCPPSGGSNKPKMIGPDGLTANSDLVRSSDPNEIIGPVGQPDVKWVSVNDRLPYTILCENAKTATAPARYIYISTPLEPKQDPTTIQLGGFGLNNQQFTVPAGLSSYYQRLDCRDSMGLYVDVVAGYNQLADEIFWTFQGIDPLTLLPSDDPMSGILFLQDSTRPNYGHGYVTFSIKPRSDAQTLDTIGARARIVFDTNDTIPTNIYTNTIDALPPTSHLNALGSSTNPVTLSWTGADDPGGCGIDYYTVYVSTDLTNFSVLFPRIRRTDTSFVLPADINYCFFVLATDRVGNTEILRPGEIRCATIGNPLPVTWLYFTGTNQGTTNHLKWATAREHNSREFIIERSLTGNNFSPIGSVAAAGNSSVTRHYDFDDLHVDRLGSSVMFYRLKQTDLDGSFRYSNIVRLNYNRNGSAPTIVYPNPTTGFVHILVGDEKLVGTDAIVMDMNGRVLQRVKINASTQSIDLTSMPNGLYLIKLDNGELLRVVKQ